MSENDQMIREAVNMTGMYQIVLFHVGGWEGGGSVYSMLVYRLYLMKVLVSSFLASVLFIHGV